VMPASARIVAVNNSSPEVSELEGRLGEMETAIETSSSLKSEPEFDRNLAEIGATRRLLAAATVRLSALGALLLPALKWVVEKAADHAIGLLITAIAALLATAFGMTIPGLH